MLAKPPFKGLSNVPDFLECKPDIAKPEILRPLNVNVTEKITFMDKMLPPSQFVFKENPAFTKSYFVLFLIVIFTLILF